MRTEHACNFKQDKILNLDIIAYLLPRTAQVITIKKDKSLQLYISHVRAV